MNNWEKFKLVDVADIKLSSVDKKTKEGERNVRLCNYTDVYKNSFISKDKAESFMVASCSESNFEKFILRKGQVAITKDSEKTDDIGIPTYISEDFDDVVLGYHLSLIMPLKDKLSGKFLNYWLQTKSAKRYFENNASGSGQRCTLVLDVIKSIPLYLPSVNIQKQIAKVLFDLETKIELNNKINLELEAMAKTIFDYWFVQFDFPDANCKPYKLSGGKMIFNYELKREIPEGWQVKTIGDYCKSTGGYAFKSTWWSEKGEPVVKIKDIQEDYTINTSTITYADLSNKVVDEKFRCKPGDVLIAMTGATVGKYGIVPFTDKPLYVNQRVGYFNLGNNPTSKLPFLINSLNQKYFREVIFILASGAAQPNISNEQINNIKLIKPPETLIKEYNDNMKPYYDKILNNQKENQKLEKLRDWLLPMLMNGQVTVREAQEHINKAAEPQENYG